MAVSTSRTSLASFAPTAVPANEVAPTLEDETPRTLGFLDQIGLWGNLGVSLLGITGAIFVLQPGGDGTPRLSLAAAITATVVGTLLGTLAVAASGALGARTGAPAMVLLRGLLGARLSAVPTSLNVAQCLGWGTFEVVTIAAAAHTVAPSVPAKVFVVIAGVLTTLLALRPLGSVRVLRRYVTGLVAIDLVYLFVQVLRHPLPGFGTGTWDGFWAATDTTVAVAVSFVPLAADYTRHARSPRAAFGGTLVGYGVAQVACYALGIVTLLTVARTPDDVYASFVAVPLGTLAFALLALRELDQSFVNVYSTAVSVQNLRPRWDRRVLAVALGVLTTVLALVIDIDNYQDFLLLLGSVFVPLAAVLIVDFARARRYDLSVSAPARWRMLLPWVLGFVAYQLVNPGYIGWWASFWTSLRGHIGFTPQAWMSASVLSFLVAAVATLLIGRLPGPRRGSAAPA